MKPSRRALSLNRGPGRGFKSNFFRLQRAPGMSRELGYVDLALTGFNFDTTGSIVLLNTVAQGASVNQRVGKKIRMKGIQCRGIHQNNSAATTNDCAVLIVYDKRPTGALPTATDILVSANSFAFNNDANAGRFQILKRHDFCLNGNSSAAANQLDTMSMSADFYLDLKGLEVVYKAAATGAIGDIEQGALYCITVGNNTAGTGGATGFMGFRLRFLDV
ncbi:capsid [uncultured virus]|uniref:Capsid n=1 Tax=uncultured virus TaxID=340016 RepID=A0A2K9LSH8_9VIRU|nr:capsid [uncultured virus]AUM61822.1 capsid [uncultured virus]